MSSSILTILDHIEKTVTKLNFGVRRRSSKITGAELARLKAYVDCLKLQFPMEFTKPTFEDFDRHLSFMEHFYEERNFKWILNNLDDVISRDLPHIKQRILRLIERKKVSEKKAVPLSNNVFLVHGKDTKPLNELKAMLKEFGLNPVVLHEKPSGGRTIVEKFEKYSDVGYAFVILTPDDIGGSRHKYDRYLRKKDLRTIEDWDERARHNVILEFGYFIGKLRRDRVCCLHKGKVELPSDMQGIVYIPFKDSIEEARDMVIKELKEAGYEIKKTGRETKYLEV